MKTFTETETQTRRVVVTMLDGTVVKGFYPTTVPTDLAELLENPYRAFPSRLVVRNAEDGAAFEIDISEAKAVFFVKRFEGDSSRRSVRFYTHGPAIHGIWVEVRFKDNEVIEGIISNSVHHLVEEGFLLSPTDPDSNNEVIYVRKNAISNYRVLGVRTLK